MQMSRSYFRILNFLLQQQRHSARRSPKQSDQPMELSLESDDIYEMLNYSDLPTAVVKVLLTHHFHQPYSQQRQSPALFND